MIIIDNYCIEQYPMQNKITINLPQTIDTLTNTITEVTERRTTLNNDELSSLLLIIKALYEKK